MTLSSCLYSSVALRTLDDCFPEINDCWLKHYSALMPSDSGFWRQSLQHYMTRFLCMPLVHFARGTAYALAHFRKYFRCANKQFLPLQLETLRLLESYDGAPLPYVLLADYVVIAAAADLPEYNRQCKAILENLISLHR